MKFIKVSSVKELEYYLESRFGKELYIENGCKSTAAQEAQSVINNCEYNAETGFYDDGCGYGIEDSWFEYFVSVEEWKKWEGIENEIDKWDI